MRKKKIHLVMTTINEPKVLGEYARLSGAEDVLFHVVGDYKTPGHIANLNWIDEAGRRNVLYWSPEDIHRWWKLSIGPVPISLLGHNHDSLRNVAFLYAYAQGADLVITVDDDNAPEKNFFEEYRHRFSGPMHMPAVEGWANPYYGLKTYPRGFPYDYRYNEFEAPEIETIHAEIAFHQGLTYGDPDVDALTRFNRGFADVSRTAFSGGWHAATGFTTVNTQNSALRREFLPYWWAPRWCGRHWDIVAGFIVQMMIHLVDRTPMLVTAYGTPFTSSVRNEHDLMKDIEQEVLGTKLCEKLAETMEALIEEGIPQFEDFGDLNEAYDWFFRQLLEEGDPLLYHLGEAMQARSIVLSDFLKAFGGKREQVG